MDGDLAEIRFAVRHQDSQATSRGFSMPATDNRKKRLPGKSANPDFTKTTLYLTNDLHHQIKVHAVAAKEDMSDLVERVMADYFTRQSI